MSRLCDKFGLDRRLIAKSVAADIYTSSMERIGPIQRLCHFAGLRLAEVELQMTYIMPGDSSCGRHRDGTAFLKTYLQIIVERKCFLLG